jgi:hypothetical protein
MKPVPILCGCSSWSSAIGNFIANFGMLDLLVQDFLENTLPPNEFLKIKEWPFYDRVELIKKHVGQSNYPVEKKTGFEQLFRRLDPLRETRNHIAHGILRIGLAPDQKTPVQTLSLPRDLDGSNSPDARHLSFEDLNRESRCLTELIEEFQKLTES